MGPVQKTKWKDSELVDLTPTANPSMPMASTPPAFCQGGIFSEAGEEFFVPPPPKPLLERSYIRFGGLFALFLAVLAATKPSIASFEDVRLGYNKPAPPPSLDEPYHWLFADPAFCAKPRKTHASDHGVFSIGYMDISPRSTSRRYEHWFVGVLGGWYQLPFMPRPGKRNFDTNQVALGTCWGGYCMVVPSPGSVNVPSWVPIIGNKSGKGAKKKKKREKTNDKKTYHDAIWSHVDDWVTFRDHMDVWINVLLVPNFLLALAWQFPGYYPMMFKHFTLSLNNFKKWRLWTLLTAPFAHREIVGAVFNFMAVSHFASGFFSSDSQFSFLLFIYVVSCWIYWFFSLLAQELIFQDSDAQHMEGYGATGAVTALLAFMAMERPGEPMQINVYMIRAPMKLLPILAMPIHILMAFIQGRQKAGTG